MIPQMPALIPTNNNHSHRTSPSHPMHLYNKFSPSDDKLHKNLDNQILLVKILQQMMLKEQRKLEMMMKPFSTGNEKKKREDPIRKRRGRPPGSKTKKKLETTAHFVNTNDYQGPPTIAYSKDWNNNNQKYEHIIEQYMAVMFFVYFNGYFQFQNL